MRLLPRQSNYLVILAGLVWLIGGGSLAGAAELEKYAVVHRAMGSLFQVSIYADDEEKAKQAIRAALARIDEIDERLNDYQPDSELSRLSAASPTAKPVEVSADLLNVLSAAQAISRQSDGAFDVTAGPLTKLWRGSRRSRMLPAKDILADALAGVGFEHVVIDDEASTVELKRANMRLDLGGIAKGYAADQALAVLKKHGVTSALVNCGGDMAVGDAPPGKPGWTIAVAPLTPGGKASTLLSLSNCGIATSGDAFQYVEIEGTRYSHIVDPKTGLGLTHRSSVTVVAKDGMAADGLASAVSVLGPEKGLELIAAVDHAEALVLQPDGDRVKPSASKGFTRLLFDTDKETEPAKEFGGLSIEQWRTRLVDFDTSSPAAARSVPHLIELVRDQSVDNAVRRQAALVLGRIGEPARAAVPLMIEISSAAAEAKQAEAVWAVKALALMREDAQAAAPALAAILSDSTRPLAVRQMTIEALGQIGGGHPDAVRALVGLLQEPGKDADEEQLRQLAVEGLGIAGTDAAVAAPLLVRLLRSPDESEWMRRRAATTLGTFGGRATIAIEPLVETLQSDESEAVRDEATKSLAALGRPGLPYLQRLLSHTEPSIRRRAATALGTMGETADSARPLLITRLRDRDAEVRLAAAESAWLIKQDAEPLLPTTVGLLTDEDRQVRIAAARLLAEFGDQAKAAGPVLRQLQSHPRREVRQIAGQVLDSLSDAAE